jgi:hypothetical protein
MTVPVGPFRFSCLRHDLRKQEDWHALLKKEDWGGCEFLRNPHHGGRLLCLEGRVDPPFLTHGRLRCQMLPQYGASNNLLELPLIP